MRLRGIRAGLAIAWILGLWYPAEVGGWSKDLRITTDPPGAQLTIDGAEKPYPKQTPADVRKFVFDKNVRYVIRVSLPGYESEERPMDLTEARSIKEDVWELSFKLQPLKLRFPITVVVTNVADAIVTVGEARMEQGPYQVEAPFTRPDKKSAWSSVVVKVEKAPRYAPESVTIAGSDVERAVKGEGKYELRMGLQEIQRVVPVEVKANVPSAQVSTNGVKVGVTPMTVNLLFSRATPADPWPEQKIRVEKDGYEYSPSGSDEPLEAFEQTCTIEVTPPAVNADTFKEVQFVYSPVRFFRPGAEGTVIFETNYLSEVVSTDPVRPTPVTSVDPNRPLVLSRISIVPNQQEDTFVYSMAVWESRPLAGGKSERVVVGANLYMYVQGRGVTQLTRGNFYDLDPCVTEQFVYFSSDRVKNKRTICRVPNPKASGAGLTHITGIFTEFDTEPSVSADGSKIAFVSRPLNAPVTTPSVIYTANPDGTMPTARWEGRNPAWAPRGSRLAFISEAGELCVVDEGRPEQPTKLDHAAPHIAHPFWLNEKQIMFASDKQPNARRQNNYDIFVIDLDTGKERQLTVDGSFDFLPTANRDNGKVFFYSNRGARRFGEDRLQILSTFIE